MFLDHPVHHFRTKFKRKCMHHFRTEGILCKTRDQEVVCLDSSEARYEGIIFMVTLTIQWATVEGFANMRVPDCFPCHYSFHPRLFNAGDPGQPPFQSSGYPIKLSRSHRYSYSHIHNIMYIMLLTLPIDSTTNTLERAFPCKIFQLSDIFI